MVPIPSSPRRSIGRPVSSPSGHLIRASISDTTFPHVSRQRRRPRHRSSSTSNSNDISRSLTYDSDDDTKSWYSEHPGSSPEPVHHQPVPIRAPLTRLSDPPPALQDSRIFRAPSPSEDEPFFTYLSLPPTPITSSPPPTTSRAERYRSRQDQSDVYIHPFSLWDYLREELLATDFDSHQELKWERVSNFLSIPIAIEKVSTSLHIA
jgi:hypothetical protein